MPVPKSSPAHPVTSANFEGPFEPHFTRFGMKGLNINDAIDAIEPDELSRMLNVTHTVNAYLTSRAGQTNIYGNAVGSNNHSIRRLNDPQNSTFTRTMGIDNSLYIGDTAKTLVDSGYSGDPLTFVPYHPPISGDPWMYVADTARMRKVRADGLDLPIGLPAPATIATSALAGENKTTIADFSTDGTQAANWTGNRGYTYDSPPVLIDGTEITAVVDDDSAPGANFGAFKTTPTLAGYYAFYGVPRTVDMSMTGGVIASDDDYIHLKLNFSHTQYIKEFRVYLVCSAAFSTSVMPGFSDTSGANSDAYVKAFSANDFAAYIQAQLTQIDAAELARIRSLRDDNLTQSTPQISKSRADYWLTHLANNTTIANEDVARTITQTSNAASDQWQGFGVVSVPLRRGDWQRIGTTTGRDWSTITGIIVYIQTGPSGTNPVGTVGVRMSNLYMTGGSGPDSGEPADSPFDYRYTNYDPRTGAEGNPSPEMLATNYIDSLRRSINVTPAAYSDAAIRQRFYRRGGTLPTDWFFAGVNTSNGGVFVDTNTDADVVAAGAMETDNDQPVSTVTDDGTTVYNQPLSSLWGPLQDLLFGCGDPYQPGNVYFCKPGNPESWPPENVTEVTSPGEPLLCGCLYGGQSFVFSSERCFILYPNFSDGTSVTATNTQCTRGPVNRWALVAGIGGMYFVNDDGLYRTSGGPEEWLSEKIDPLFKGQAVNGLYPIDFSATTFIRLEIFQNELYFQYRDILGYVQTLVYSIPFQFWRLYTFTQSPSVVYSDEGNQSSVLLIGGRTSGKTYQYSGTSDDGEEILANIRTGAVTFGNTRLEKRLGDQAFNVNTKGIVFNVTNYLNDEAIQNPPQDIASSDLQSTIILDSFGEMPQRARNIATDLAWSTADYTPVVYWMSNSVIIEPEVTLNRMTQWDDMGMADPFYLMGVTLDCDTGAQDRTINIDIDLDGAYSIAATLTVNCDGRHKKSFSWSGVKANKVRIRPEGTDCDQWQLFKGDWNVQAQPPTIAAWDSYFENAWDQYYTGLDLFCDTGGLDKTIEVYVDNVLVKTETVNTAGRLVWHITLPWGRGHVFRFVATDGNPGTLYDYRWQIVAEPSEQTNWNQNFTTQSALYDKWLKAVIFECDTFGEDKTVTIECDGVVVETLTVNANGRKVVQKSFPQHLGRVFRAYPTDDFPSRIYSLQWQFDGEPLALDRWETQESTLGIDGWSYATYGQVTIKSNAAVTLTIVAYNQSGTATTKTYIIPSTSGVKVKTFVPFEAVKGILHKFTLTCSVPFWLYQEETTLYIREWGTDRTAVIHPFGDSDVDKTRSMVSSQLAAARPGGEA